MASKALLELAKANAEITHQLIKSSVGYQYLKSGITFQDLKAIDVALDPDTKNRYFRDELFTLTDSVVLDYQKSLGDSFSVSDLAVLDVTKTLSDSTNMSDNFSLVMQFNRDFSDAVNMSDSFSFTLISGSLSVLNVSALNEFTLNS